MPIFSTSSGKIELDITSDHAHIGSHSGQCDQDVAYLRALPEISAQLEKLDPVLVVSELEEWGAWDEEELKDHDQNLSRLLWLACGDIVDQEYEEEIKK